MVLHDALHDPQTKAGPLFALGTDKRFKHRTQQLFRYTRSGISDAYDQQATDALTSAQMLGADDELSALGHAIAGIHHQVGKQLPELIRRPLHGRQLTELLFDIDPRLCQWAAE